MPNNLGFVLHAQGRIREALPYYADALAIRDATLGPTHPVTAQSLNNLAEALRTEGQRDEAERLHRRAIEIRRTRLAPEHPDLAESLNNLGVLLTEERRFDEAQALFDEALAIRVKALGEQHSAVAEVRSNLGALAFAQGDLASAEQRHREVLAIEEAVRGADDAEVAIRVGQSRPGADGRGQARRRRQRCWSGRSRSGWRTWGRSGWRPRRAATPWRWRWQRRARTSGPSRSCARPWPPASGCWAPTRPSWRRCWPTWASWSGGAATSRRHCRCWSGWSRSSRRTTAPRTCASRVSLNNLALLQGELGNWRGAEPLLARAVAIEEEGLGRDSPELIDTLENRASVLERLDRHDEAGSGGPAARGVDPWCEGAQCRPARRRLTAQAATATARRGISAQ